MSEQKSRDESVDRFAVTQSAGHYWEHSSEDELEFSESVDLTDKGRIVGVQDTGFVCHDLMYDRAHPFRTEVRVGDYRSAPVRAFARTNDEMQDRLVGEHPYGVTKLPGWSHWDYVRRSFHPDAQRRILYDPHYHDVQRIPAVYSSTHDGYGMPHWASYQRYTPKALKEVFGKIVADVLRREYRRNSPEYDAAHAAFWGLLRPDGLMNCSVDDGDDLMRRLIDVGNAVTRTRFDLVSHETPEKAVADMTERYADMVSACRMRFKDKHKKREARSEVKR